MSEPSFNWPCPTTFEQLRAQLQMAAHVEEFSSAGVQPLPRPRFAWLFGLVDRVIHRALIAVSLSCCAAAGAGLYREDASAAAWIVLAVAVDLLLPELRRIWYEFGSDNA